jgi:hypothetical protein
MGRMTGCALQDGARKKQAHQGCCFRYVVPDLLSLKGRIVLICTHWQDTNAGSHRNLTE